MPQRPQATSVTEKPVVPRARCRIATQRTPGYGTPDSEAWLHGGAPPGRLLHGDEAGGATARKPEIVVGTGIEGGAGRPAAVGAQGGGAFGPGEGDLAAAAGDDFLAGHAEGGAVRPDVLGNVVRELGEEQDADDHHGPHQGFLHNRTSCAFILTGRISCPLWHLRHGET